MKLFIPTSSLNFNNIMSCESVSPYAFYMQRNFGYRTFEKVELNNLDNSLLLFENFPEFQIPKSELVNYPMVIEVDIDSEYDGLEKIENGIWQIDRTLYLNPFNSNIYFLSSDHKRTILSRSESSAETKLVNLYRNNIKVCQLEKKKIKISSISDLPNPNYKEIENDKQKNKIKGFAYAYLIAANRATSKEIVRLKNLVKKTINISSAIINSVSGQGTQQQKEELIHLLQRMNEFQYKDVKEYLKERLPNQHNDIWNAIFNQFGLRNPNINNFDQYYFSLINKSEHDTSIQELKDWSRRTIANSNQKRPIQDWNNIAISGNRLTQYEDTFISKIETREMYQNLINDIFVSTDVTEASFSSERSRLADDITRKIKSYIGDENWKSHDANKYLNNLRRNIAGQEAFNLNWNTGLISAIATFLLKGEDFQKLGDFLVSSEIEDGRLAFGFYGCICGFANLSRVFTHSLFNSDLEYFTRTYKTIFKQLHNIALLGELPEEQPQKAFEVDSKIRIEEKKESIAKITFELIRDIESSVPESSRLSQENKVYYYGEINNFYTGVIDSVFIKKLKLIPVKPKTKTNWNKIISFLNKKAKNGIKKKHRQDSNVVQTIATFDEIETKLFYNESNAFDLIASFIPKTDLNKVKSEIEWIQKVHQKNGYKRKNGSWVSLNDHSNEEVIKHLRNNIVRQGKISLKTIDIVIDELKKIYY